VPLTLPLPVPGTLAVMTMGPPNFSAPEVTSSACSRCTADPPSKAALTTYSVPETGSITGVPVMPTWGWISVLTREEGIVVALAAAPWDGESIDACQSG